MEEKRRQAARNRRRMQLDESSSSGEDAPQNDMGSELRSQRNAGPDAEDEMFSQSHSSAFAGKDSVASLR